MKLLQDLLEIKAKTQIVENEDHSTDNLGELVDKYIDQEKMYHFEGPRGVKNFEKILTVMGYQDIDSFLQDNSGVFESIIEWIKDTNIQDWKDEFTAHLHE